MLGTLEEDLQKIEDMEDSAEFQMKLQGLRKRMLDIKRWSTAKYLVPFFLILMPRLIGRDSMILCFILIGSGLLFYYLKYHKMPEFFSNMESLQDVYAKEVLEPLLQNFYPDLTVEKKGIALEDVVRFTPKSQKYLQDTFLFFHDDRGLLIGNLESYHTTGGKHSTTVYDFTGQLYCMKSPVAVQGEVRIVPTDRAFLLKNEVQYRYPGCGKGEMKLDTEDIQHNEHFDIYATDEFGTRRFLTPEVEEVLIDDNMVFDIDNLKGFLNDTSSFGFIAKENNKIIGFAYCYTLLRPDGKTMFYLHSIGMLPNYQDKGYGSKLLSFIKEYSKEIGCSEMFLITDKGNPRACHVYEKLGGKNDYKDEIVYVYDYEKGDK